MRTRTDTPAAVAGGPVAMTAIPRAVAALYRDFAGILFIGDPHVSSTRPGRRIDDYEASVLAKLKYCAELCHDYNLLPVILGDLLHRSDDNSLRMLNRLTTVLELFPVPPITLEGNHDKAGAAIAEDDALYLLARNKDAVQVVFEPGLIGTYSINGKPVRLFACPYGSQIPASLPAGEGRAIMVTHHDLAFDGAYPGAKPIRPVQGADMVVNGHMHDKKPSVLAEQTWWHNPGNIEPLSVDLMNHVPRAWLWDGEDCSELVGMDLPHGTDVFDLTGRRVEAGDADVAVAAIELPSVSSSDFAEWMAQEAAQQTDASRTDDASVLREDIDAVYDAGAISAPARSLMDKLFSNVQSRLLKG